jgi:hypothetical protein
LVGADSMHRGTIDASDYAVSHGCNSLQS